MKFKNILGTILLSSVPMFAGVSVSAPSNGATTGSPVHVVASGASSVPVTALQIYLDGRLVSQVNASQINTSITASNGTHSLVVQQWDSNGNYAKTPLTINVSGTSTGTSSGTTGSTGTTIANIDQRSGWQNCGACAGANGNGPSVPYSTTQFRSSPSLDGASQEFWLGGTTPYASAIWWNQLGAQPNATHFTYDLNFYIQNPSAAEALEFDVNQSVGGKKYIFGTECNILGGNHWDVWDTANKRWVNTGIYCPTPAAYAWHHLTWQFERVNGQIHFIAVTLDGQTSYVNRYFWPMSINASELNVAFQLDGNYRETNYSVWLDKISLNYY